MNLPTPPAVIYLPPDLEDPARTRAPRYPEDEQAEREEWEATLERAEREGDAARDMED